MSEINQLNKQLNLIMMSNVTINESDLIVRASHPC